MWSSLKSVGPSKALRRPQGLKKLGVWREPCFLAHWLHFSPPYLELSFYLTAPGQERPELIWGNNPRKNLRFTQGQLSFFFLTSGYEENRTGGKWNTWVWTRQGDAWQHLLLFLCTLSLLISAFSISCSISFTSKGQTLFNHFYWHITTLTSPDSVIKLQVLASRPYADLKCSF